MNRVALGPALRRRLAPLVVGASVVIATCAPAVHFLQKRSELLTTARVQAALVATVLRREIDIRPRLWRYDAAKLDERLVAEGLGRACVVARDADGADVPLHTGPPPRVALWGRAVVVRDGAVVASVWVALDAAPLLVGTAWLALGFALLALTLGAILYLLPMRAVAVAEGRITALLGQLALTLQEEDRRRIARDLHDGAGQALTAARLRLLALRKRAADGPLAADLPAIAAHLDDAIEEVRRSTSALSPAALTELGFIGALVRQCETVAAAAGIRVECRLPPTLPPLAPHVETACYRMVQEALTNTARHAGARRAWVEIGVSGGELRLIVGDDGRGVSAGDAPSSAGHGLEGIRDRATLLGGSARLSPATAEGGFLVEIHLPLEQGEQP